MEAALANVFPGAHPHVADWPDERWHSGAAEPLSSQALCVSVWGTLAVNKKMRTRVVTDIFNAAGLVVPSLRAPRITCEAGDGGEFAHLLNEVGANSTPTCVDALVEWSEGVVAVESKLGEPSFGSCGQVQPKIDKPPGAPKGTKIPLPAACTGNYGSGSDQKTGSRAPCRLQVWDGTRAPRLYWQVGWDLFRPEVLEPDGRPCPFAGPSFQLMRNLALACAAAAPRSHRPDRAKAPVVERRREFALLVAHVDGHPNAAAHHTEFDEFRELLLDDVGERVGLVTYEQISDILLGHGMGDLADDIDQRIALIAA